MLIHGCRRLFAALDTHHGRPRFSASLFAESPAFQAGAFDCGGRFLREVRRKQCPPRQNLLGPRFDTVKSFMIIIPTYLDYLLRDSFKFPAPLLDTLQIFAPLIDADDSMDKLDRGVFLPDDLFSADTSQLNIAHQCTKLEVSISVHTHTGYPMSSIKGFNRDGVRNADISDFGDDCCQFLDYISRCTFSSLMFLKFSITSPQAASRNTNWRSLLTNSPSLQMIRVSEKVCKAVLRTLAEDGILCPQLATIVASVTQTSSYQGVFALVKSVVLSRAAKGQVIRVGRVVDSGLGEGELVSAWDSLCDGEQIGRFDVDLDVEI